MTAPEVCQYVNQASPSEYLQSLSTLRVETRFLALNAVYQTSEERWLVNVQVIAERQILKDRQWLHDPRLETIKLCQQYYFYETTGAVIRK